jgi:hypothetical protein
MSSDDPVIRLLADLDRPARPRVEFRDSLLARLLAQLEDGMGREPAVQASARSTGWRARVLRTVRRRRRRTILAFAAVTGAAVAALFVSSPWTTAPGFLEQVNAAITPPAGSVLHVKLVMTEKRSCTVTQPPFETWAELSPPHKYRVIDILASTDLCKPGISIERGGEPALRKALVFLPPNTLAISRRMYAWELAADPDPFGKLRQAIADGTAHLEGRAALDDGRTVERVRQDCTEEQRAQFSPCDPIYVYVDPETFLPVRTLSGPGIRPGRGGTCTAECYVQDFQTYEYLPGTPANRALADIRAQHPNATEAEFSGGREADEIREHYPDATGP